MRIDFRQGIASHQSGGFLTLNGFGNVDILANNRAVTLTLAHQNTNYTHTEDNSVPDAWIGPFLPAENYWLFWEFNQLTFARTFGTTNIEPVAQSVEPGLGDSPIISATPGIPGIGSFTVQGHYVLTPSKPFAVINSTANDGNYTVFSSSYDLGLGETTIIVNETVVDATGDGDATLDIDSFGNPLLITGRMWYDTLNHIQYVRQGTLWVSTIRILAAQIINGTTFISQSINSGSGDFTGTQIGNASSVLSGRVLFDESGTPIRRDNGTFFTTEDQFFSNQSRVDGIRLESNVSRAQLITSNAAAHSVVAWVDENKVQPAIYNDTGSTVVGILLEGLLTSEVGAVVIQGVITNPLWTWISGGAPVGSPLWIDNGLLTPTDPHVADPITYPIGQVPVARVLGELQITFEQGLGGVGATGPAGSIDNPTPANTTDLGAVTLITPSSDPLRAFVISDTDSRLADSRSPLPHTHAASDVTFTPAGGVISNNTQSAIEELGIGKLNIAGGTMTGILTLSSNPTAALHAATKAYVDALVSGLIWLDPIDLINIISDTVTIPPVTPEYSDGYIIPLGATGVWSAIAVGNIVVWDGTVWLDRGALTAISSNARLGVAFDTITVPSGSFVGRKNDIAEYDIAGTLTGFQTPIETNAVLVDDVTSLHVFNQYAFNGTSWIKFSGGQHVVADDTTTVISSNILSVKQFADGGVNDVSHWQGLIPTDLNSVYSVVAHVHTLDQLTDVDLTSVAPINGDVLVYNSSSLVWEPSAPAGGATFTCVEGNPSTAVVSIGSGIDPTQYLDDTFWTGSSLSWSGTQWDSAFNVNMFLTVNGGVWYVGLRIPSIEIIIELQSGSNTHVAIVVHDFTNAVIGVIEDFAMVSGVPKKIKVPLTFTSGATMHDIQDIQFQMDSGSDDIVITGIYDPATLSTPECVDIGNDEITLRTGTNGHISAMNDVGPIIFDLHDSYGSKVQFGPSALMTDDVIFILPADNGASGEALVTDGSGNLTWGSTAGTCIMDGNADTYVSVSGNIANPCTDIDNNNILIHAGEDAFTGGDVIITSGTGNSGGVGGTIASTAGGGFNGGQISFTTEDSNQGNDGGVISFFTKGSNANIIFNVGGNGGAMWLRGEGSLADTPELRLYDSNASNYTRLRAADTISTNNTFRLPADDGGVGSVLLSDGSGNTTWSGNTPNPSNAYDTQFKRLGVLVATDIIDRFVSPKNVQIPATGHVGYCDVAAVGAPAVFDVSTTSTATPAVLVSRGTITFAIGARGASAISLTPFTLAPDDHIVITTTTPSGIQGVYITLGGFLTV